MKRKKRKKQRDKKRSRSLARRADKYDLYQRSVQEPEPDVRFIRRVFERHRGRPARTLREDFCGTALLACEWVAAHREHRAWGVDLDPEPLAWGERHNASRLDANQARRLELVRGDVLGVRHEPVDVTVAYNFSYFLFKTRPALRGYFEAARATLGPGGLLFLDAYGGPDAHRTLTHTTERDGFDYVWDQHGFDPIHHDVVNFIHFEFDDGSRLKRAFRYDWRLWSIPEIRELLGEAGFRSTEVYWEGREGNSDEGNGVFTKREKAPDDPAWVSYLVAVR